MNMPLYRSEQRAISALTRRNILDYLRLSGNPYHGQLSEVEFLNRIYDLDNMPSTDYRSSYNTAKKDIIQHTVNNNDWDDHWVFTDSRFEISSGPDEIFLRFLAETLHPLVRTHEQALELCGFYNQHLRMDGWQLLQVGEASGYPIYGPMAFASNGALVFGSARSIQQKLDSVYLNTQITRLQQAISSDPELAIGTAKEFLESIAKTILQSRKVAWSPNDTFPSLVKRAGKNVQIVPPGISRKSESEQALQVLVNNLNSSVEKLAELRNWHGTGHGKDAAATRDDHLQEHHARFAVGVSILIAQFLFDCLESEGSRHLPVVEASASFEEEKAYDPFADEYDPFADE